MERIEVKTGLPYKVYGRIPETKLVCMMGVIKGGKPIEVGGADDIQRLRLVIKDYDFVPLLTTEEVIFGAKSMEGVFIKVEDLPSDW
jgi:hypothetical protein